MLQTLQWPTLAERRARIKATMMYRIVNGLVAIPPTELHASTTTRDSRRVTESVDIP
jgi:hypothetical protein